MTFAAGCFLVVILFGVLLSVLAWSRRAWQLPLEGCRKITHVGMGLACLSFPLFVSTIWHAVCLALLFAGILALLRLKPELLWGGGEVLPASRCESEGEFYFVAGVAFALLFAREDRFIYFASVLLLTFADAAAAVVGKWIGKRHCWGNAKTVEGSLAFCLIGFFCLLGPSLVLEHCYSLALLGTICLLATATEGVAERGSDNLWIPLMCVVGLQLPHWLPNPAHWIAVLATMAAILGGIVFRKTRAFAEGGDSRSSRCVAGQPECVSPTATRPLQAAATPDEAP